MDTGHYSLSLCVDVDQSIPLSFPLYIYISMATLIVPSFRLYLSSPICFFCSDTSSSFPHCIYHVLQMYNETSLNTLCFTRSQRNSLRSSLRLSSSPYHTFMDPFINTPPVNASSTQLKSVGGRRETAVNSGAYVTASRTALLRQDPLPLRPSLADKVWTSGPVWKCQTKTPAQQCFGL